MSNWYKRAIGVIGLAVIIGVVGHRFDVEAQPGPFSAQIQAAIRSLTAGTTTFTQVRFGSGTIISSTENGVLLLTDSTGATFSRVNLGGSTNLFPGLKRNAANLDFVKADDSGLTDVRMGAILMASHIGSTSVGTPIIHTAPPSIGSGFGTNPAIVATNGTAAFRVNVGTGGTASSGVITMPGPTSNGWNCNITNRTAAAANRADQRTVQTADTTTSVTVQNQLVSTGAAVAWTASDLLHLVCMGY